MKNKFWITLIFFLTFQYIKNFTTVITGSKIFVTDFFLCWSKKTFSESFIKWSPLTHRIDFKLCWFCLLHDHYVQKECSFYTQTQVIDI